VDRCGANRGSRPGIHEQATGVTVHSYGTLAYGD
jgi:hypothetical protein